MAWCELLASVCSWWAFQAYGFYLFMARHRGSLYDFSYL